MTYLLDVNALVALGFQELSLSQRVEVQFALRDSVQKWRSERTLWAAPGLGAAHLQYYAARCFLWRRSRWTSFLSLCRSAWVFLICWRSFLIWARSAWSWDLLA